MLFIRETYTERTILNGEDGLKGNCDKKQNQKKYEMNDERVIK